MTNRSFSDLSINQRRERIAAVLAVGLQRVLDQRAKISASSGDPCLEVSPELRLSVSQPKIGEPDKADETRLMSAGESDYAEIPQTLGAACGLGNHR